MPLDHLAIDSITEADLQELIDNGVAEGRDIDFKAQSWGNADKDKHEFLADISAFANTVGGHIVVGMQERNGIAHALPGLSINPDQERLRLEQLAQNGLQPRIRGLGIQAVLLANGHHALVIRVPRSWNPPHRVIAQGSNRFWARAGNGKYQPDVDQLRELFAVAPTLAEKIRDFRFDRLARIKAGDTPLRDVSTGALVLHVIPYDAYSRPRWLGVPELRKAQACCRLLGGDIFFQLCASGARPNLDGLVVRDTSACVPASYVQLWRNGSIEAACRTTFDRTQDANAWPYINICKLENACIMAFEAYVEGLQNLSIGPPAAIFLTLLGVRHRRYYTSTETIFIENKYSFAQDDVLTSDIGVERWPHDRQAVARLLRPAFDEIANAAGLDASPTFDKKGRWVAAGPQTRNHP